MSVTGSMLDETLDLVVVRAFTKFCKDHKRDIVDSPYAYLPIRDQSDSVWRRHVDSMNNENNPSYNPIVATMVSYTALLYLLF